MLIDTGEIVFKKSKLQEVDISHVLDAVYIKKTKERKPALKIEE